MQVTPVEIKELRNRTGLSVMDCKHALEEAHGDMEKALILLRKKSSSDAAKKADRELGAGVVQAYIHASHDIGALIALACETDFVAKNEEFVRLAHNIALHATATNPRYISKDEVQEADVVKAREIFIEEAQDKPEDKREAIVAGKMESYLKEQVLLDQPYVKDPSVTIAQMLEQATQKFGERIKVVECARFSVRA
jgi:elongation factor Ts